MESSRRKSKSRESKLRKILKVKDTPRSSNVSNPNRRNYAFTLEQITEDSDTSSNHRCYTLNSEIKISDNNLNLNSDSDESNEWSIMMQLEDDKRDVENVDSGRNRSVNVTCRPCSVVLERLPETEVQNSLSKNNSTMRNIEKNRRQKQPHRSQKFHSSSRQRIGNKFRNREFTGLNADIDSKKTTETRLNDSTDQKQCNEVESSSCSDKIIENYDEPHSSNRNGRINEFGQFSHNNKLGYCKSSKNQVPRYDFWNESSENEDSNEGKGSEISLEDIESKLSVPSKPFNFSLKKKTTNREDDEICEPDHRSEILATENMEGLRRSWINSVGPENKLALRYERLRLLLDENITDSDEIEACRLDTILQTEDLHGSRSSGINFEVAKDISTRPKRIKLSLRRRRMTTENDAACRQDLRRKFSPPEDFHEISMNNVLPGDESRRLSKRKRNKCKEDKASCNYKLKKTEENQDVTSHDHREVKHFDSAANESSASRRSNRRNIPSGPKILNNSSYKQNVSPEVSNELPTSKNVRVSLFKTQPIGNPTTSKRLDNVKASDHCLYTCETVCNNQTKILDEKTKDLSENWSSTSRNTKITDYFSKIVKSSVVQENKTKNFNRNNMDLILKKKYGICQDVIVSLIDLKELKISKSKYSASEIEKLTQGYASTSVNCNSTNTTANVISSSSVSPSNKLRSCFKKLSTNDEQSSIEFTNLSSSLDDVEEPSHDLFHTHTVQTSENLSPMGDKLLQLRKQSSAKRPEDSLNDNLFLRSDTLKSKSGNLELQATLSSVNEISNSQIRKSAITPEKCYMLINNKIETKETEVCVTNVNSKSPKTSEIRETNGAISRSDTSEALPDGNGERRNLKDTSVVNEDLNSVIPQPDAHSSVVSVIKSPKIVGKSRTYTKQEKLRFPVNSMTFFSREMIEENSSWIGLEDTIDNNVVGSNESQENANVSEENGHSVESENNDLFLPKLLDSKNTKDCLPELPAFTNIENCLSNVNTSTREGMVETKIDGVRSSDTALKIKTSIPSIPIMETMSLVKDSIDLIPVECVDQDGEKSSSQNQPTLDPLPGKLIIETDENDSDPPSVEGIPPRALSSNRSTSSITMDDEETSKKTIVSSEMQCIICKKKFKSVTGLGKHLQVHVKTADSCCMICDKPVIKKNVIEHYLEHCGYLEEEKTYFHTCSICNLEFTKHFELRYHMKKKHNVEMIRRASKIVSQHQFHNKCTICLKICESAEDLQSHIYSHTGKELQDAYEVAMAKQQLKLSSPPIGENRNNDILEKEKTQNEEHVSPELTEPGNTLATLPPAILNCEVSICMCHNDERLEISGGVIIEVALACLQCKTFFKSRNCFRDHYTSSSCKWNDKTEVIPKMFCNECGVILNSLQDMHSHLTQHSKDDVEMKTSFLCKHCNIFFFGIGSIFYTHWFSHCNDPLSVGDLCSPTNNKTIKIIELGCPELTSNDEPMECLFVTQHECHDCGKPFQTEKDLKEHLYASSFCSEKVDPPPKITEKPKSSFKLICSICNKEFIDKATFNTHIEEHDTIKGFLYRSKHLDKSLENNQLTCSICKTEYDTITNFKEHLNRHEIIQEKFVCNYCTLMMDSVQDFELHSTEHKGTTEKPVACKVIFATAKFHCKPCKLWFDDQSLLDKHLVTHSNFVISKPKTVETSTPKIVAVIEKENHVCATCKQEFDDQVKLDAHVATYGKDALGHSIVDSVITHLSHDSNSTDKKIAVEKKKQGKEPVVENTLLREKQKTSNAEETKKPVLRVKNLQELLPYTCSKCKAEFDTQINLNKHLCKQNVNQDTNPAKQFNYCCKICQSYQCMNNSDWNQHVLSHFLLQSFPTFSDPLYNMLKMQSGQRVFRCNICRTFGCLTTLAMWNHFITVHPSIIRPIFKCRVCHTFKTEIEQEIRRHEAAHFQQPSVYPQLHNLSNNLSSVQLVENSNNTQQTISSSPVTSSGNNSSSLHPVLNYNFQPPILVAPETTSGNNLFSIQPILNHNKFQQPVSVPSLTSSGNNLSLTHLLNNSNNSPRPVLFLQMPNSGNNSSSIQPPQNSNSYQQSASIPPVSNPGNNSPVTISNNNLFSFQPSQNANKSQQAGSTLQPYDNFKNFQQSTTIPSVNSSGNNSPARQPDCNPNNLRQTNTTSSLTSWGSDSPSTQTVNNTNKLHETLTFPTVTSTENNLSSLQPADNSRWLATKSQSCIQISDSSSFNNITNVVRTIPVYGTNTAYCCRICKNLNFSTKEELKVHESLHELVQSSENSKRLYRCKVCTNIFCPSEDHLKAHMKTHHNSEKTLNVPRDRPTEIQVKCKHCLQTFASTAQLTQHMRTCNALVDRQKNDTQFQNVYPYSCQLCSIGFLNNGFLQAHMRQIHPNAIMPSEKLTSARSLYECDVCGLLLISEATLKYHLRSHNTGYQ